MKCLQPYLHNTNNDNKFVIHMLISTATVRFPVGQLAVLAAAAAAAVTVAVLLVA